MKTVSVALVLCLNVGVDPPDIVKTQPCARLECWIGKCFFVLHITYFIAIIASLNCTRLYICISITFDYIIFVIWRLYMENIQFLCFIS